ncbi:SET domain-containing protein 9 isoform X4 [Anser cygnoides]|uniref:SET domain-containing protein 9 isoform X4 n=1 Tax=Anser cygnoides TaxID=8845 RepID=UPI00200997D6|nr:SET domain-containing protein 9 isoform X3 [Anser cygnoides]
MLPPPPSSPAPYPPIASPYANSGALPGRGLAATHGAAMSRGCAAPCCGGCGGAGPPTGTASCPGWPSTSAASAGEARTLRYVPESSQDKIIPDEDVLETLLKVFAALFANDLGRQAPVLAVRPEIRRKYEEPAPAEPRRSEEGARSQRALGPQEVLFQALGFGLARGRSSLPAAGTGVFVSRGGARRGAVVAMYPGTVYRKHEPIFFQSLGNPFIFRCIDGVLIDGNDKGLSKAVYRSCSRRDQLGPFQMSDVSWLTAAPQNPLAVGQYVNNCSYEKAANVCYQEFDVPRCFPVELKQYLPNIVYSHDIQSPLRCVVLVTLRDIKQGEELFSNYYTVIN